MLRKMARFIAVNEGEGNKQPAQGECTDGAAHAETEGKTVPEAAGKRVC